MSKAYEISEASETSRVNAVSELKDLTKYRLDEINNLKEYFNTEIKERKYIIKKNSKYIVAFDYADKILLHYQHRLAL